MAYDNNWAKNVVLGQACAVQEEIGRVGYKANEGHVQLTKAQADALSAFLKASATAYAAFI